MAEKRMFSKTIIDSDLFLDMPASSRLLYFDLNMRADDDGFVKDVNKITETTGASKEDLTFLIDRAFALPFGEGVVVVNHPLLHEYIRQHCLNNGEIEKEEKPTTPEKKKEPRHKYGEYKHVMLTDKQRDKLFEDYGMEETLKAIDRVDEYCEETGKSYKNYNLTIRRWGFDSRNSSKSNRANDRSNTDWSKV